MELRNYQQECIEIINNLENGSGLVSMATGLGKTVVFSNIKRKGRVLVISHREELVHQPIKYYDCPCGVEQGNEFSNGEEVVLASVQSLIKRLKKFSPYDFDIIITDEAHHSAADSYRKIYNYFKPRLHIGFTATPNRGDKVRLDDIYDKIIYQRDLKWGIKNGWLTDINCFRVHVTYSLNNVKRRMGDFVVNDLDKAMNTSLANKEIADVYRKYAKGQTLIFATSVSHAENIAAEIEGAVIVSQKTKNRKEIIDAFTRREIPCIVNCMIFTEGTDMPLVETIIIARPTQNASLYIQMVGRGLRKYEGKEYLTLIDCVGVTERLNICTAPTLLGLDIDDLPEKYRDSVSGKLTDMFKAIEAIQDRPAIWILNIEKVRLFAKENGVDLHGINWTKKSNGDLVYQFTDGNRIGIKAIDELGKTQVMRYYFDEDTNKFVNTVSDQMSLQDALDNAYKDFIILYEDERSFWDLEEYERWQHAPATEKQRNLIKSKLTTEEYNEILNLDNLSKGNASQIINMLNIRNLTVSKLLNMHQKKLEKKKAEENKKNNCLPSKIEYLINQKISSKKYYAVQLIDKLVITNEWWKAEKLIDDAVSNGLIYKCKGFNSLEQAIQYLK